MVSYISFWFCLLVSSQGFPGGTSGKEPPCCLCRRHKRRGSNPWVRKIPWRRAWQPTPVFSSEEYHGQNIHGVAKSWTWLKWHAWRTHTYFSYLGTLWWMLFLVIMALGIWCQRRLVGEMAKTRKNAYVIICP